MDYVQEEDKGKKIVKKLGLAPVMRDSIEYEFSTVFDIGLDHSAKASKDRTGLFPTERIFRITEATGEEISDWLKTAKPKPEEPPPPKAEPKQPPRDQSPDEIAAERIQRIEGRMKAARECKPADVSEEQWLSSYALKATAGRINNIAAMTLQELREASLHHGEIVEYISDTIPS